MSSFGSIIDRSSTQKVSAGNFRWQIRLPLPSVKLGGGHQKKISSMVIGAHVVRKGVQNIHNTSLPQRRVLVMALASHVQSHRTLP
jgi:hypothetical protein